MPTLPFSQAAKNNAPFILTELARLLHDSHSALEIGAGTGQHAVAFAEALPSISWQPTEHPSALTTLQPRCELATLTNLLAPKALDIGARPWEVSASDAVYTANTLHIVSAELVESFFDGLAQLQEPGSLLVVYGPFNYDGRFTTQSNENFDAWLKDRDPRSGIRDFEWVDGLAASAGYALEEDIEMPANNRLLVWRMAGRV